MQVGSIENGSRQAPRTWLSWLSSGEGRLTVVGIALLGVWVVWWAASWRANRFVKAEYTGLPAYQEFLGLDFMANDAAGRSILAGRDPYDRDQLGDPLHRPYCYPPPMPYLFLWCGLLSTGSKAAAVWFCVQVAMLIGATAMSLRVRRQFDAWPLPFTAALAAVLLSFPVMFALERGQCDILVIAILLASLPMLRHENRWVQMCAGALLAMAPAIKVYPFAFLLGLAAMRRPWAILGFTVTGAVWLLSQLRVYLHINEEIHNFFQVTAGSGFGITRFGHSFVGCWRYLWEHVPVLAWLRKMPPFPSVVVLLGGFAAYVAFRVWRSPNRASVTYPLMLWLAALGTFFPKIMFDYNLLFLPLAMAAVWDRRDPVWVHLLYGLSLLTLVPFALPISPQLFFFFKLAGLAAIGLSIVGSLDRVKAESSAVNVPTSTNQSAVSMKAA